MHSLIQSDVARLFWLGSFNSIIGVSFWRPSQWPLTPFLKGGPSSILAHRKRLSAAAEKMAYRACNNAMAAAACGQGRFHFHIESERNKKEQHKRVEGNLNATPQQSPAAGQFSEFFFYNYIKYNICTIYRWWWWRPILRFQQALIYMFGEEI